MSHARFVIGVALIAASALGGLQVAAQINPGAANPQRTATPTLRLTATRTPAPTPTPTPRPLPFEGTLYMIPTVESEHPYPNAHDQSWLISNPDPRAGATRLRFAQLDLEDHADWLIVLDGFDNEIQRFTGKQANNTWTDPVPGTLVKLRLVSDGTVQRWGFIVDALASVPYTTLAYSPHPYPNNSRLEWRFSNLDPNARGTRLKFSRVELEENVDWLVLMDLSETPYQWITGNHPNGLRSIAVPGNGVVLRLISDSSVRRWGFNLEALESATPEEAQARPEVERSLVESEHPYPTNLDKTWTLVNPNPAAAFTKVRFAQLDVGDTLFLYDGNGNLIQDLSGKRNQFDVWSDDIPGRVVKVQLVSDGIRGNEWGFRIDRLADGEAQVALAESEHPYPFNLDKTWTLVNPNPAAAFTKVRFAQLDVGDTLFLYDGNGNLIQDLSGKRNQFDVWSDDIPGRVVKVRLVSDGIRGNEWGFRIDDIAPKSDEKPVPAFISAVRVWLNQPGDLWVNDAYVGRASAPGEYLIRLPDPSKNFIKIETLFYEQEITVRMAKDGSVRVEYGSLTPKEQQKK